MGPPHLPCEIAERAGALARSLPEPRAHAGVVQQTAQRRGKLADIAGSDTRVVLDYSSGASLVTDRDTYRFTQQAQDVHEYGVSQARRLASSGNYGPWTADVLAAWHA